LFDLLMRRFDALQPHRASLEALRRDLPADPLTALAIAGGASVLDAADARSRGIACHGIGGMIAVKLVAAAYLAAGTLGRATSRPTSRRRWRRSIAGCAVSSVGWHRRCGPANVTRGGGLTIKRQLPALLHAK
jgi:hypothetical protein